MITAGIDCGAKNTKTVILKNGEIIGKGMVLTGFDQEKAVSASLEQALQAAGISKKDLERIAGTGSGKEAVTIADAADVPLNIFTQLNGARFDQCQARLDQAGLLDRIHREPRFQWTCFQHGSLDENLMAVPYDSLAVVGAAGQSIIRELVFGSKLELIQSLLPNPLLIVGPRYQGPDPACESRE